MKFLVNLLQIAERGAAVVFNQIAVIVDIEIIARFALVALPIYFSDQTMHVAISHALVVIREPFGCRVVQENEIILTLRALVEGHVLLQRHAIFDESAETDVGVIASLASPLLMELEMVGL